MDAWGEHRGDRVALLEKRVDRHDGLFRVAAVLVLAGAFAFVAHIVIAIVRGG